MDANFKQRYMEKWMEELYGKFPKYYQDTLDAIIWENTELQEGVPSVTDIMYVRGTAYFTRIAPIGSNPNRYELHSELKDKVQRLFIDRMEIADETVIVQGYLRRVLNLCTIAQDIPMLLPANVIACFTKQLESIPTTGTPTVPEEKYILFQHRNKQFSDLIPERILTNLLLTGG